MKENTKLSSAEIASFCSQTSLLIQSGITPLESIRILYNDAESSAEKGLLQTILDVCKQGEPFHKALAATEAFPDYVIHMISLGEESGNLEECIASLANYYEKEDNIASSLRSAVTYPLVMIVMMMTVIFVLISKVMPIFQQVFKELGSEMTGFAATMLNLGQSLNGYSGFLVIGICILIVLYLWCTKTSSGRAFAGSILQRFPLTKGFYESIASQRFASGLAICLQSGIDIYTSLDITRQLVGKHPLCEKIENCRQSVMQGAGLSEALTGCGIFNHLYSQMIAVGFKSGNVDVVLNKIADGYEKATDKKIQSIISILEPTLVIILSIIVGLILLSVILPLMGIMASIG